MTLYLPLFFAGFLLGVFAMAVTWGLVLCHRPRHTAPTKHHRKWPDRPERKAADVPREVETEERVRYQFMGATGLEE